MLATRLHGIEDLRRDVVSDPVVGGHDVLVHVAFNGLCGTDLGLFFDTGPWTDGPQPIGHEISGVVIATGELVDDLAPGTAVCVSAIQSCGGCDLCRAGLTNLCEVMVAIGCGGAQGGLSELVSVPRASVFSLPAPLGLEEGALVEPMSVAYNGILRSGIQPGESAVVLGGGPIGIGVLLGLRAIGVDDVVVVEPSPTRRRTAGDLGARRTVDPTSEDSALRAVRTDRADGRADVVFICASAPDVFITAMKLVRTRGRVITVATFTAAVAFEPQAMLRAEAEILATLGYTADVYRQVIEHMRLGRYPTVGWVEHISWNDIVTAGLEPLRRGAKMKLLVDVRA